MTLPPQAARVRDTNKIYELSPPSRHLLDSKLKSLLTQYTVCSNICFKDEEQGHHMGNGVFRGRDGCLLQELICNSDPISARLLHGVYNDHIIRIDDNSEWRLELVFDGLVIPSYDSYDFTSESFQKKYLNPKTRVFSHSPWNWRDSKS